jgi:GxxExxY protein
LILEAKVVEKLAEVHEAQVIGYLKATGVCLGLLINFNVALLKDGIKRIVYFD